ncbi:MAG: hypothetical protein MdMp014T_0080 [Treponematales bacterium]
MKAGDTLSGIAQAAYGDMTLWGGVWEANKAKLPSAANPHNLPAGTVLSLPRFDTEAAKTSARNARHAAPAFTGTGSGSGAAAANARPVPYSDDYGSSFEYLPVAFTKKQIDALPFVEREGGSRTYTYGGVGGWFISGDKSLRDAIAAKNPGLLKYAIYSGYDALNMWDTFYYNGKNLAEFQLAGEVEKGVKVETRYVLVRAAQ